MLFLSLFLIFNGVNKEILLHVNEMLGCFHFVYAQSCTSLHIINELRCCKLDDVHIFETQGIVDRVTQLKIFISLFCTVA